MPACLPACLPAQINKLCFARAWAPAAELRSLVDIRSSNKSSFQSVADSVSLVDEHSGNRTGGSEGGDVRGVGGGSANPIQPAAAVEWTEDHDAQL